MEYMCPKCKTTQKHMIEIQDGAKSYSFEVSDEGDYEYDEMDFSPDDEPRYFCPNCDEEIAVGQEQAAKMFKKPTR